MSTLPAVAVEAERMGVPETGRTDTVSDLSRNVGGEVWVTRKGRVYSAGDRAKAEAHWKRKVALRNAPGRCGRCAAPWTGPTRHCDHCRDYQRQRKAKLKVKLVVTSQTVLDDLAKRVASLEHELARMQVAGRAQYRRGYGAGQRIELKRRERIELPTITKQELATMNHAYVSMDAR
jgi:hypothetical protein